MDRAVAGRRRGIVETTLAIASGRNRQRDGSGQAAKLSAVPDFCVVCGSDKHSRACACARCKRILDRVEMRRDAAGALRRFDRDARLGALRQSGRDGAFRCYYTGISLITGGDRWRDHRYLTFEHRTPGDETSVVVTCALVNRMRTGSH
jgi:hypothetical protein